ncbi:MAG: hypothetical protein GQ574_14450 [Crocinitomix sp.]|nr:hypothetical protein [Crocinitomix sp.]
MEKAHGIFISLLKVELPTGDALQRQIWAKKIVNEEIPILRLSELLLGEKTIALRFSWLLSDVGMENSEVLYNALPSLFESRSAVESFDFEPSFATYWSLVGVPYENETAAIDLLLRWLQSPFVNVTTKSRALIPIEQLALKYPELKMEISIVLQGEVYSSTAQFQKRVEDLLGRLE